MRMCKADRIARTIRHLDNRMTADLELMRDRLMSVARDKEDEDLFQAVKAILVRREKAR